MFSLLKITKKTKTGKSIKKKLQQKLQPNLFRIQFDSSFVIVYPIIDR